jgi:CheY-like chemotaxis protein
LSTAQDSKSFDCCVDYTPVHNTGLTGSLFARRHVAWSALKEFSDEPGLLEIATAYLEEMGFTVYEAEDGASAIEVVSQHGDIDLLITNIIMPGGMNGVEFAQKLRRLLPKIKIVYTSGFVPNTLAERSMPLLYGELLRKPYQRADFETAIHMALR